MFLIDLLDLEFIDPKLREIMSSIRAEFGVMTITSLYRIDDDGVHGVLPLRGIDLRCRNNNMGAVIEDWVNRTWFYDPKRPKMKACIYHDTGRGIHLHIQSHPNTVKRDE